MDRKNDKTSEDEENKESGGEENKESGDESEKKSASGRHWVDRLKKKKKRKASDQRQTAGQSSDMVPGTSGVSINTKKDRDNSGKPVDSFNWIATGARPKVDSGSKQKPENLAQKIPKKSTLQLLNLSPKKKSKKKGPQYKSFYSQEDPAKEIDAHPRIPPQINKPSSESTSVELQLSERIQETIRRDNTRSASLGDVPEQHGTSKSTQFFDLRKTSGPPVLPFGVPNLPRPPSPAINVDMYNEELADTASKKDALRSENKSIHHSFFSKGKALFYTSKKYRIDSPSASTSRSQSGPPCVSTSRIPLCSPSASSSRSGSVSPSTSPLRSQTSFPSASSSRSQSVSPSTSPSRNLSTSTSVSRSQTPISFQLGTNKNTLSVPFIYVSNSSQIDEHKSDIVSYVSDGSFTQEFSRLSPTKSRSASPVKSLFRSGSPLNMEPKVENIQDVRNRLKKHLNPQSSSKKNNESFSRSQPQQSPYQMDIDPQPSTSSRNVSHVRSTAGLSTENSVDIEDIRHRARSRARTFRVQFRAAQSLVRNSLKKLGRKKNESPSKKH